MKLSLSVLFILFYGILSAQQISSTVYDNVSKAPLDGATVYLDGTNIGTITDMDGRFNIDLDEAPNASIVIRFIGYKTRIFSADDLIKLKAIYLEVNPNRLDEVVVEADTWSRAKKMRIFKMEFLGKTIATKYCKIKNEDDIYLKYSPSTKTLIAYADTPIIIENKYLGYTIEYNLVDFEAEFSSTMQGLRFTQKVYSAGTCFFRELNNTIKKKYLQNRHKTYQGSMIHFMRAYKKITLLQSHFK